MEKRKSPPGKTRASKRRIGWLAGLCLFAAGLSAWGLAASEEAAIAPSCDATTGASCKVVGVRTTLTQAIISWTEGKHNGSRYFCYGIGSPSKCASVTSRASGVKNQVVTGLTPRTKYAYKFYGVYSGKTKSVVTGTFTTDSSGCGTTLITEVEVAGVVLSSSGDSLPNVVAVITRKSDMKEMGRDTTDQSGGYHFAVDPGTYLITFSDPPFNAPAAYTATVIASKPLAVPDQILTGAFLVSGTVVSSAGDSLIGAAINVLKKSDNSQVASLTTDSSGYFFLGLKSGDYLINAAYQGHSLPSPIGVTINKSMVLPNLVLPLTSAIRVKADPQPGAQGPLREPREFDAKGARLPKQPAHTIESFEVEQ